MNLNTRLKSNQAADGNCVSKFIKENGTRRNISKHEENCEIAKVSKDVSETGEHANDISTNTISFDSI